ncbi:hypothetical protein PINS_up008150 [Pythium insidiosum]|nr:hypothetical protein PINS_up008150 [Pythium insidiosum]
MDRALRDPGVRPDVVMFNTVLSALRRALLKHQRREKAASQADHEEDEDVDVDVDDEEEDVNVDADADADVDVDDDHNVDADDDIRAPSTPWIHMERDLGARVRSLLDAMQTHGVAPTRDTFRLAASICALRGDAAGVLAVVDRLQAHAAHSSDRVGASAPQQRERARELLTASTLCCYVDACRAQHETHRLLALQRELRAPVPRAVVRRLVDALDAVGCWQDALQVVKHMQRWYGLAPSAADFAQAMAICNRREAFDAVEPMFVTMERVYRVAPTAACFVERILALEQREQWVRATQEFINMQRTCRADELTPALLRRIALGRYSERGRRL